MQDFTASELDDERPIIHGIPFSTWNAYDSITTKPLVDCNYYFILCAKVPSKVKIFGWLLFRDRLNTKENLHHKNIAGWPSCPRYDVPCEDVAHITIRFGSA